MHACAAQPCLTRQAGQCTSLFNFARCTFNAALHHIKFCGATDHAVSAITSFGRTLLRAAASA